MTGSPAIRRPPDMIAGVRGFISPAGKKNIVSIESAIATI
jgi:hypothetical protein